MRPKRSDDAIVDLLDVVLRDGVVVEADVIVTVADIPLVGISLRAAVAGMTTMTRHGLLEERNAGGSAKPTDPGGVAGSGRTGTGHSSLYSSEVAADEARAAGNENAHGGVCGDANLN